MYGTRYVYNVHTCACTRICSVHDMSTETHVKWQSHSVDGSGQVQRTYDVQVRVL